MKESQRIFIGFPIAEDFSALIDLLKTTVDDPENIRWTYGKKLHLTLLYIGDLEAEKIDKIINKMNNTDFRESFNVSFGFTGIFPEIGTPRIYWLGVDEGKKKIHSLNRYASGLLNDCSVILEKRTFIPHLTLGRANARKKAEKIDSKIFLNAVFSPVCFRVKSIHLYSSEMMAGGVKYTSLTEVKLK